MKIKFPLKMEDGALVSTIEELQQHYDYESLLYYYVGGELIDWLENQYYDSEADLVRKMKESKESMSTAEIVGNLVAILKLPAKENLQSFQSNYATHTRTRTDNLTDTIGNLPIEEYYGTANIGVGINTIRENKGRLEKLRKYTADDEILENAELVVFNQQELIDLLTEEPYAEKIYLCGDRFAITEFENVRFIGVNKPKVYIADFYVRVIFNIDFDSFEFLDENVIENIKNVYITTNPDIINPKEFWYDMAVLGNTIAEREMGNYFDKLNDYSEAFVWFNKAADKSDKISMYQLGVYYYNGYGVQQNYEEALEWFNKSAEKQFPRALNYLGLCYLRGHGIKKNHEKAVEYFTKSAELGYASAQNNLGCCFYQGMGVEKDYLEAEKWYKKAADQGYAKAQFRLGECYDYGYGVKKNNEEAFEWYKKAADQGLAEAQNALGYMYYYGKGVEENNEEAFEWYKKAADQGYAEAQFRLGECYDYGYGVEKSYSEAMRWYEIAAEQGHQESRNKMIEKNPKAYNINEVLEYAIGGIQNVDKSKSSFDISQNKIIIHVWNLYKVKEGVLEKLGLKSKDSYQDYYYKDKANLKGAGIGAGVGAVLGGPFGAAIGGFIGNAIAEPEQERVYLKSAMIYLVFDQISILECEKIKEMGIFEAIE